MTTLTDLNLLLFLLLCILAAIAYAALGLVVLLTLDRHPTIEAITDPIEGWVARILFALWPLTATWLLWRLARAEFAIRRLRRGRG